MKTVDLQRLSPAFVAVENVLAGLHEKYCVAVLFKLLNKVYKNERLVEDQVSTEPVLVLLIEYLLTLERLKDQLALEFWTLFGHYQRVWIDL